MTIGKIYDIIYTNTGGRYIQTLTEGKTDDIPQENTERVAFAALTEELTMKSIKLMLSAIFALILGGYLIMAGSGSNGSAVAYAIGLALSLTSIVLLITGLCTKGAKSDTDRKTVLTKRKD